MDLTTVAGFLGATGDALINLDEDRQGWEDYVGDLLVYGGEVLVAVRDGEELPPFPASLNTTIAVRVGGAFRASLIVASAMLSFIRFQVSGRAGVVLGYITQVIRNLLAGVPTPTPPVGI